MYWLKALRSSSPLSPKQGPSLVPLLAEQDVATRSSSKAAHNNQLRWRRASFIVICRIISYILPVVVTLIVLILLCPESMIRLTRTFAIKPLSIPSAWSPVDSSAIRYETYHTEKNYWSPKHSLYMGEPSPEGDRAWNAMIHPHGFRISIYEAAQINLGKTMPLKGGGLGGTLGVYHNLHCLRRLRQRYFKDYYYPNQTESELSRFNEHDLHCLEALRKSIMCHPDLTVNPYYLSDDPEHVISVSAVVDRECVDWGLLEPHLSARKYDRAEYGMDS